MDVGELRLAVNCGSFLLCVLCQRNHAVVFEVSCHAAKAD